MNNTNKLFYYVYDIFGYTVRRRPNGIKIAVFVCETHAQEYCDHRNKLVRKYNTDKLIGYEK